MGDPQVPDAGGGGARGFESVAVDWSALAQELGYFDQAHFIRDFKAQIGRTPAAYAAACARVG